MDPEMHIWLQGSCKCCYLNNILRSPGYEGKCLNHKFICGVLITKINRTITHLRKPKNGNHRTMSLYVLTLLPSPNLSASFLEATTI